MPYLQHIRFESIRCVSRFDVDLEPCEGRPFHHLILTGPNGSGKSGILEHLAAQLSARRLVRGEGLNWTVSPNSVLSDFNSGDLLLLYVPALRMPTMVKPQGPSKRVTQVLDLENRASFIKHFLQFLVNKKAEQAFAKVDTEPETVDRIGVWFDRFELLLSELMEDEGLKLVFNRTQFDFTLVRSDGYRFGLTELADGHAAALHILAEILFRIDTIRTHKNDREFEPEGVVLVDEIETHLHVSLQELILPWLTGIFPRLQFVVATHSPAVITSIDGAVVYDLRKNAVVLSDELRGIRYGTVMTQHFGIESDYDLESSKRMRRLEELLELDERSTEEESELRALAQRLSRTSHALTLDVWRALNGPKAEKR